jgi:hypothetical protein
MDSTWIGICTIVSRIDDISEILWIPPELLSIYRADLSAQYILLEMQHHFRLKRGLFHLFGNTMNDFKGIFSCIIILH